MGDYSAIGEGIVTGFMWMAVALAIFVPLGLWKLVELIIALVAHIHWG